MPQQLCVLNGVTFSANPYPYSNPGKHSVTYNPTLTGGYRTVMGSIVSDQVITATWALMDRALYVQLDTIRAAGNDVVFVDPYGVSWTVHVKDLTYQSLLKGGDDALSVVVLTMLVVSQP